MGGGEYDGLDREVHVPLHSPHNNSNLFKTCCDIFKIERIAKGSKDPLFPFLSTILLLLRLNLDHDKAVT